MTKRIICGRAECIICLSIGPHNLSTLTTTFLRGYIAGMHRVCQRNAEEHVCQEHAKSIDEAVAFYVGNGVSFPTVPGLASVIPLDENVSVRIARVRKRQSF